MSKSFLRLVSLSFVGLLGLTSCGTSASNSSKPVVFFNRQPSDASTGELDTDTLNFNDRTYYVGFDSTQGGEAQGQMVVDYIADHVDTIDRNGDGTLGYVLAIGDQGHNDSIARTKGVREALGTYNDSTAAGTGVTKEGSVTVGDKTFKVEELASQEMKNTSGATWDAPTAGTAIATWKSQFSDQIDLIISNNDGMGMAMYNAAVDKDFEVPVFGYDANSDAVEAINPDSDTASTKGIAYAGTISQHAEYQAFATLELIRNALDGVATDEIYKKGISEPDQYGNQISGGMNYVEGDRSLYALNEAVTADNYTEFLDSTAIDSSIKQITSDTTYKVWIDIYNSADNFLSATFFPLLNQYATLLDIDLTTVQGDGNSESSVTNSFTNLSYYDAYAINMVKTSSGDTYTNILKR